MVRAHRIVADVIGVCVLAALAALIAWGITAVYTKQDAIWAWAVGFPVAAISALVAWHHDKWPLDSRDVLLYGLLSIPMGAVSLVVDFLIGSSMYPRLPFRYAVWEVGSPFGIVLTICICPGFTLVALSGAVRAVMLANSTEFPKSSGPKS